MEVGPPSQEGNSGGGSLLHDYINILLPVAVHNAVNCYKKNILSSFMVYKYMYELHLTQVLLINIMTLKLCVCARLREEL